MGQKCVQGGSTKRFTATKLPNDIEDCLNMNIFTPALPSGHHAKFPMFPVLFYIHGGSFSTGSNAEFPASYILEHNIVLVVPNYRLDALGNNKYATVKTRNNKITHVHIFLFRFFINKNS